MSDQKETGGPAFPTLGSAHEIPGMSLRDYFAAHAMAALLMLDRYSVDNIAKGAFELADAMLHERDR